MSKPEQYPRGMTLRLLLGLVAALILLGCSDDEPVKKIDYSRREELSLARPDEALTYAYLPQYSHTVSYRRHRLLVDYLSKSTGLPMRQVFPDTFDEHRTMVERGEIDISYSNPFIYIKIAESGARAFARVVEDASGKPDFRGEIICRADNPAIRNLDDCRGKRWMAVDPSSAGGYLFALGHFVEHGILPEDFSAIEFAPGPGGKQEKVVLSVQAGNHDLGSIREGTLNVVADRVDLDQIKVLARTRAYPGWVYAARQGLDPAIVDALARAMFRLKKEHPEQAPILEAAQVQGIIPAADADYDPVRDLARTLGLE